MHSPSVVLAIALGLGCGVASAEVVRCADAAGNVSYTDSACPAGARAVGRVAVPEPTAAPVPDSAERARPPPRESTDAAARSAPMPQQPPPPPSGPAVIDSRGNAGNDPAAGSRWNERGSDPLIVDDGYGYPGTYARPAPPPRDMRPRIRNCDAGGCEDRQGNRYNRTGELDRYQSLDGKTCRPVGTTTICR